MGLPIKFDQELKKLFFDSLDKSDETGTIFLPTVPPGTAFWLNGDNRYKILIFSCPCGCHAMINVPVNPGWTWNGSLEKPTLSPSVLRLSGCKWHGWITNGEFINC